VIGTIDPQRKIHILYALKPGGLSGGAVPEFIPQIIIFFEIRSCVFSHGGNIPLIQSFFQIYAGIIKKFEVEIELGPLTEIGHGFHKTHFSIVFRKEPDLLRLIFEKYSGQRIVDGAVPVFPDPHMLCLFFPVAVHLLEFFLHNRIAQSKGFAGDRDNHIIFQREAWGIFDTVVGKDTQIYMGKFLFDLPCHAIHPLVIDLRPVFELGLQIGCPGALIGLFAIFAHAVKIPAVIDHKGVTGFPGVLPQIFRDIFHGF
jgi:hypothetical protein